MAIGKVRSGRAPERRGLSRPLKLLGLLSVSAALLGCTHISIAPDYSGPKIMPAELIGSFSYQGGVAEVSEEVIERTGDYTSRRITFPSAHTLLAMDNDIVIDYFDIRPRGKAPVVMVLPILGGTNGIAEMFAAHFAANGYAAVLVHRQKEYKRISELASLNRTLTQIVIDQRQAIDWIETRPELDAGRIAVFGVSMGGIKGALLSAVEKRIRASVLVLAGGDIPYILTYSEEKGIAEQRRKLMKEQGLSRDELYRHLNRLITADPLQLAPYIDARKTLLILGRYDTIVPFVTGEKLRRRIGHPETIYLAAGHYTAALYAPFVKYQAVRFFNEHLGSHQGRAPLATREAQLTSEGKQAAGTASGAREPGAAPATTD